MRIAITLLADFRQAITRLHCVALPAARPLCPRRRCARRSRLRRALRHRKIRGDIVRVRIDQLNFVPNFIFNLLRRSTPLYEQLIVLHMQILQLYLLLLNAAQHGLIFLFQLFEPLQRICILSALRATAITSCRIFPLIPPQIELAVST